MLHKIQQFVQLGIIAAFEQTAVGNHGGGLSTRAALSRVVQSSRWSQVLTIW